MLKAILASLALVFTVSTTTAQAHPKHEANIQCFNDVDSLRKVYPAGHAYYTPRAKGDCWHVHKQETQAAKIKPAKEKPAKPATQKERNRLADADEQLMRDYMALNCTMWLPATICYLGR